LILNPPKQSVTQSLEILTDYFGWRDGARARLEKMDENVKSDPSMFAQEVTTTLDAVQSYLSSDGLTNKRLMPLETSNQAPDADWSSFSQFMLARVRACNKLPGPRMRIVWGMTLAKLGRLPRWPNDHEHVLDAEALLELQVARMDSNGKIDGRIPCFSFFTHRWLRPSYDPKRAHPDSTHHEKAKALAEYCAGGTCSVFVEHTFDYYYWIDFCGIDQDDPLDKALGICKLPCYVTACFEAIFYHSALHLYEPRVWTRVERMISYMYTLFPLFTYIDEEYPKGPINIKQVADMNAHMFSWDPDSGTLLMKIHDPLGDDACITNEGDLELIQKLLTIMYKTKPLNSNSKTILSDPVVTTFGEYIKFGETMFDVDTKHYSIDLKAYIKAGERLAGALAKLDMKMSL